MTVLDQLVRVLSWKIKLGNEEFSILHFIQFFLLISIVFLTASVVRRFFHIRVLARAGINRGLQEVLSRFAGYIVVIIGLFISLQIIGVNLSSLAFLAGTLSLGLGFGLQNVISNFVSGLIILIERPIQIGDRIDVGGLNGDVKEIKARSTTIVTNDNITIIVPNSEFISSRVINWSHGDPKVRFCVPIAVTYGSNPKLVERTLLEVAHEISDVLKNPAPAVRFMSFGENSLNFELRIWTDNLVHQKNKLVSMVNFGIFEKFRKYNIEIPFPQRDVHIKRTPTPLLSISTNEAVAMHLLKNRLFEALTDHAITQLVGRGQIRKFYSGQKMIQQGDAGDSLFIILNGTAEVKVQRPDGTNLPLLTLGCSDFFGEMSMLTGEKRSATIKAESFVEAFEITKDCLQPILSENPRLVEQLSRSLVAHQAQRKTVLERVGQLSNAKEEEANNVPSMLNRIRLFFNLSS